MAVKPEQVPPASPHFLSNVGITPIPDPTVLTTQASERAVSALKELLIAKIDSVEAVIATRLHANDKAIDLFRESADRFPKMIAICATQQQLLYDEKFKGIQVQFIERDTRTEQAAATTAKAVDAALAAQKEAALEQNRSFEAKITKSETAFTKQLDQLSTLMSAGTKASDEKISDLKDRLTIIESHGLGSRQGTSDSWGIVLGVVGSFSGIAALITLVALVVVK